MNKSYSEKNLILPALKIIYEKSQKGGTGITTTELIHELEIRLKPSGDDLLILQGRRDTKFSQKVRNLISHDTLSKYILKDNKSKNERLTINEKGIDYLSEANELDDEYSANLINDDFRDQNDDCQFDKTASVENIYYSVSDLKRKFDRSQNHQENVLHLDATFQRGGGIWNNKRKSLLIESILLNIPIPSIYLSEDEKGSLIVIDGRQRLSTLFDFIEDKFKLNGLSLLSNLNKKKFSQLTGNNEKYRAMIEDKSLHIAKIRFGSDETFIIETFERVNTKGVRLNAQEIRNALHQGQSTKLLNDISSNFDLQENIVAKKRMKDKYLVLRFLAMDKYYRDIVENNKINFKSISNYLSNVMKEINQYDDKKINEIKQEFINIFNKAIEIFGENTAFRLDTTLPLNMILFEITLLLTKYQPNKTNDKIKISLDSFLNSDIKDKMTNEETPFFKNIRYHRDSKNNIEQRLKWVQKIAENSND